MIYLRQTYLLLICFFIFTCTSDSKSTFSIKEIQGTWNSPIDSLLTFTIQGDSISYPDNPNHYSLHISRDSFSVYYPDYTWQLLIIKAEKDSLELYNPVSHKRWELIK